jgi:serine protease Do
VSPNTRSIQPRRALNLLLTLVILLGASSSAVSAKTPAAEKPSPQEISVLKRAVVIVTTFDSRGKPLLQGSGFFIETDCVVTNMHVIKAASSIRISTFEGKTGIVRKVIAANEKTDLALLQVESSLAAAVLQVEAAPPVEGEAIIVLGNPQGSPWKVTRGRIASFWQFAGSGGRLQITAEIFRGSSGGPVVNEHGRVIGIAAMHLAGGDDVNFAIPAENLRAIQASTSAANQHTTATGN